MTFTFCDLIQNGGSSSCSELKDDEEMEVCGEELSPESQQKQSRLALWYFLLDLLIAKKKYQIIQWTDKTELKFKFVKPAAVADLWGASNTKNNMTYAKFSRAIRYYYGKEVLEKVQNKQFHYRFVKSEKINTAIDKINKQINNEFFNEDEVKEVEKHIKVEEEESMIKDNLKEAFDTYNHTYKNDQVNKMQFTIDDDDQMHLPSPLIFPPTNNNNIPTGNKRKAEFGSEEEELFDIEIPLKRQLQEISYNYNSSSAPTPPPPPPPTLTTICLTPDEDDIVNENDDDFPEILGIEAAVQIQDIDILTYSALYTPQVLASQYQQQQQRQQQQQQQEQEQQQQQQQQQQHQQQQQQQQQQHQRHQQIIHSQYTATSFYPEVFPNALQNTQRSVQSATTSISPNTQVFFGDVIDYSQADICQLMDSQVEDALMFLKANNSGLSCWR